jgi:hypothetical protein
MMSTSTKSRTEQRAICLLGKLQSLREDRGEMAVLRRARVDGTDTRACRVLGRLDVLGDEAGRAVAWFFARHPGHYAGEGRLNFGGSCRLLTVDGHRNTKARFPRDAENRCSFDARFRRVLASHDRQALVTRVHQILPLLEQQDAAVDYVRLYRDLVAWGFNPESVRWRWAQSYWGGVPDLPSSGIHSGSEPKETA